MVRHSMMRFSLIALVGLVVGSQVGLGTVAHAQTKAAPMFFDQRRLPDMEVERRNQEVLLEQRRVDEERRAQTESAERNNAMAARLAAEAQKEAQRKIDEDKQIAAANAEAEAKRKADEMRLAADTKRKADEDKLIAANAEADAKRKAAEARTAELADAKRKADEDKLIAANAEADAKRKAAEARTAELADAKRKADEDKLIAANAEADAKRKAAEARTAELADAKRKADEDKLIAANAEVDAKRKAQDEKRVAALATQAPPLAADPSRPDVSRGDPARTVANLQTESPRTDTESKASCDKPKITTQPLSAGRMAISANQACRKGQRVSLVYGPFTFAKWYDAGGKLALDVDLYLAKSEQVRLVFADGSFEDIAPVTLDLDKVSKVAIVWDSAVNLDLHALQNVGIFGSADHIWAGAASSAETANGIVQSTGFGSGFMSTKDDGKSEGQKVEVFTYIHAPDQKSGAVSMMLDFASRGDRPAGETCVGGDKAAVPFEAVVLTKTGVTRSRGVVSPAPCGTRLVSEARYMKDIVPDLVFGP
jgi:hypothetical protein